MHYPDPDSLQNSAAADMDRYKDALEEEGRAKMEDIERMSSPATSRTGPSRTTSAKVDAAQHR